MLRDADRSVANWLADVLPPGTQVRFGAPQASWSAAAEVATGGDGGGGGNRGVSGPSSPSGDPAVGVFLYGIRREDRGRESSGWAEVRDGAGRLLGRQPSAVHHQLSYMIAAWAGAAAETASVEQAVAVEHELLGLVLEACCAAAEVLPQDALEGALAAAELPASLRCGGADALAEAARLWPGFGIPPRAHLVLELVVPVVPPMVTELGPPVHRVALGARQLPEPASGTDAAGTRTGAGTGSAGSLRRTGRSTITEPPARPPRAGGSEA